MNSSFGRNRPAFLRRWLGVGRGLPVAAALMAPVCCLLAASSEINRPASPPPAAHSPSNAPVRVEVSIPRSIFVIPKTPAQGRDPFFPNSTRLFASNGNSTNRPVQAPIKFADLFYKGVSMADGRPLAIINTHTFAVGEEADVAAGTKRMRVRCL